MRHKIKWRLDDAPVMAPLVCDPPIEAERAESTWKPAALSFGVTDDDIAESRADRFDRLSAQQARCKSMRAALGDALEAWAELYLARVTSGPCSTRKGWALALREFESYLGMPGTLDDLERVRDFAEWMIGRGFSRGTARVTRTRLAALRRFACAAGAIV